MHRVTEAINYIVTRLRCKQLAE